MKMSQSKSAFVQVSEFHDDTSEEGKTPAEGLEKVTVSNLVLGAQIQYYLLWLLHNKKAISLHSSLKSSLQIYLD